jgi:hypothetical protein
LGSEVKSEIWMVMAWWGEWGCRVFSSISYWFSGLQTGWSQKNNSCSAHAALRQAFLENIHNPSFCTLTNWYKKIV